MPELTVVDLVRNHLVLPDHQRPGGGSNTDTGRFAFKRRSVQSSCAEPVPMLAVADAAKHVWTSLPSIGLVFNDAEIQADRDRPACEEHARRAEIELRTADMRYTRNTNY